MEKFGIGKASGKIILMGEHAVVYGQPAIAVPFLATKVMVSVKASQEDFITSLYYDGPTAFAPESLENILQAFFLAKKRVGIASGLLCKIESSIPPERGMGSSAAVANAVIRAVFDYQKVDLSQEELAEIANEAEIIAHGNPSGIDQATTASNRPIEYAKNSLFCPFSINCEGFLLVADSKLKGRTREIVQNVATLLKEQPEKKQLIENLGKCTLQLKACLQSNQVENAANIMEKAQDYLSELKVSHPVLDHMLALGKNFGALGGKLTGGGGGGCVIFLAKNLTDAENIKEHLIQAGYPTWIQDLREFT